ncbi:MAG: sodium-dependent bicarbonate transport family permease, partial [Bdellovibrionota bacterium]
MEFLGLTADTLRSPAVLFFLLGLIASICKSDLRFPESLTQSLGLYLVLAIGFKGGVELTRHDIGANAFLLISMGVAFSFLAPFLIYTVIPLFMKSIQRVDRIAISAHYGSVSLVTFIAATSFLDAQNIPYEGYLVILLTLMETPAILSSLVMYARSEKQIEPQFTESQLSDKITAIERKPFAYHLRHVFFAGSSFLLIGSFVVGFLSGGKGAVMMYGFLNAPFQGILALFLLDMGMVSGRQLLTTQDYNRKLLALGLFLPLLLGIIGLLAGTMLGLELGDKTLFAMLCGGASYIVVPAAMRMTMPEANHGLSITLALGITFPFNIIFG